VFILVHGTWAHHCAWHKPEGDFFCALEESAQQRGARVVSFCWDSKNTHEARLKAAQRLERLIMSYSVDTQINIVAHSHGANVANIASQLLVVREDQHPQIKALYYLGAPVCMERYAPNMEVVQHLYNFFSFRDFVQPVLGLFGREYPAHDRIANMRVTINNIQPDHSLIHDPELARWIPLIHQALVTKGMHGFDEFQFGVPGIIRFVSGQHVHYEQDDRREALKRQDRFAIGRARSLFVRYVAPRFYPHIKSRPIQVR